MLADVSQSIPDTGGGISGFVAHGLWHIYRHFPSSGRYDYLLLFVFLMVVARVAFLPYMLNGMKRDIAKLRKPGGSVSDVGYSSISTICDTVGIWVLVWFFGTDAGKTFLIGRTCFGQELTEAGPVGISFLCWFCVLVLSGVALWVNQNVGGISKPNAETRYYLYEEAISWFMLFTMMILAAHILYWYWSRATILLFWSYLVAVVLTVIIRIKGMEILLGRPENSVGPD